MIQPKLHSPTHAKTKPQRRNYLARVTAVSLMEEMLNVLPGFREE